MVDFLCNDQILIVAINMADQSQKQPEGSLFIS